MGLDMRPVVEIVRLEESGAGTFGILKISKQVFCVTLEQDDEINKVNESSIPAQQYICEKSNTNLASVTRLGFDHTWEVKGVPKRWGVKFHPGNTIDDTAGCILLARSFGALKGDRAILNSGNTFTEFMALMGEYDSFHLTIKEEY